MAEAELWLVDLDKTEAALEALESAMPRLSEDMHRRLGAMADAAARRERRLAHIALRILLETRLGPGSRHAPIVRNSSGKPSLAGHDICFSLAHTAGLALIALCERDPVGVDIERMRQVRVADARRAPIEAEAIALAAGAPLAGPDRDARFLNAWVRIEAVAKARGSGVGAILGRLRPGQAAARARAPQPHDETRRIVAHDVPMAEDLFAAVALAADLEPPPPPRVLPDTPAAIEALLDARQGTKR